MEAVCQDIVDLSIADVLKRFRYLRGDLASNAAAGTAREKAVAELIGRFEYLRQKHLARARALLRQGLADPGTMDQSLLAAHAEITRVSRELGSILLRAGMSYAVEVFTHELGDMATQQEEILSASLALAARAGAGEQAEPAGLAERQRQVAERVGRLVKEAGTVAYAGTQALSAVRLSQARKQLQGAELPRLLAECAEGLRESAPDRTLDKQRQAIRVFRETEARLRPEARLADFVRGRNQLRRIGQRQQQLHTAVESVSASVFLARQLGLAGRQEALRRPLLGLSPTLGIDAFVAKAEGAVGEAVKALAAGQRPATLAAQGRIQDSLARAIALLDERIAKLQRADEAYLKLKSATERLRTLLVMEDRLGRLRDAASTFAGNKEPMDHLAPGQRRLAQDANDFIGSMPTQPSNWSAMMPSPMRRAAAHMNRAAELLGANQGRQALSSQDEAASGLREGVELAQKEVSYLEQIWVLTRVAGDFEQFAALADDIGREQQDLRAETERAAAEGKTVLDLTGKQQVVVAALAEMREMVSGVDDAAALDERLVAAAGAAEAAAADLAQDRPASAIASQKRAEKEFQAAKETALSLAKKMEHAIAYLSSMEQMLADIINLLRLQIRLRKETEVAEAKEFPRLAGEQDVLRGDAGTYADWFERIRNSKHFRNACNEMGEAIRNLNERRRGEAVRHQKLAEDALRLAIQELHELMQSLLTGMPGGLWWEEIEFRFGQLVSDKIVWLILKQRGLRNATQAAGTDQMPKHARLQAELEAEASAFVAAIPPSPVMDCVKDAASEMALAARSLARTAREEGVRHQQLAEKHLRRALTTMILALVEQLMQAQPGMAPGRGAGLIAGEGMITLWAKGTPSDQQDVKARKSEFDPLGKQDRDALNEHFARELPLEYRDLLKNYYEALSK